MNTELCKTIKTPLDKRKFEMACNGYYLPADIAKIKKFSRQHVGRLIAQGKFETTRCFFKTWVKYDNGELAKSLYMQDVDPLSIFKNFGFKQRLRHLVEAESLVCDIVSGLCDGGASRYKCSINYKS
jgi:hypothetical protein